MGSGVHTLDIIVQINVQWTEKKKKKTITERAAESYNRNL